MSRYNEVFLLISNHHSLIGCWEQVEITLKTFKNAKIPIRISSTIIPNKVNIIIEDFSNDLTIEIAKNFKNASKY